MDFREGIRPVARQTSNAAVYRAICDLIVNGRAGAGSRLVERKLAEALGVSRTPVREALIRLKTDGFVIDAGRKGLAVAPLDLVEGVGLYRLVGAMESHLIAEITSYPEEMVRQLEAIEADSEAIVGDRSPAIDLGADWHRVLVEPSANGIGKRHLDELAVHVRRYEHYYFAAKALEATPASPDRTEGKAEHNDISRALADGDTGRAAQLSRHHWNRSAARLQVLETLTKRQA